MTIIIMVIIIHDTNANNNNNNNTIIVIIMFSVIPGEQAKLVLPGREGIALPPREIRQTVEVTL